MTSSSLADACNASASTSASSTSAPLRWSAHKLCALFRGHSPALVRHVAFSPSSSSSLLVALTSDRGTTHVYALAALVASTTIAALTVSTSTRQGKATDATFSANIVPVGASSSSSSSSPFLSSAASSSLTASPVLLGGAGGSAFDLAAETDDAS